MVFAELPSAAGSMGWFYGFKLHLLINDCGESWLLDHPRMLMIECRCQLYASACSANRLPIAAARSPAIIWTTSRHDLPPTYHDTPENMKNRLLPWLDKLLLRKRAIIESVVDQLNKSPRSSILASAAQ